ncbi:uncharacterized protein LOC135248547 [Anguilla rostrata]|uniref:uncharacterized protein LOC135248547 n=1 Tax=Anguilla rostrata TaxID=7938 RepID=UPI0030D3A372
MGGQRGPSSGSSSSLSELRNVAFSSRSLSALPPSTAVIAPGLKRYPQEGALSSSLPASSGSAEALLSSLSASGLSAEALLSPAFRQRLLRETRPSPAPPPGGRATNAAATASSPTSTSPSSSSSPSSPTQLTPLTLSSLGLKPSGRGLQYCSLNSFKEHGGKSCPNPAPSEQRGSWDIKTSE